MRVNKYLTYVGFLKKIVFWKKLHIIGTFCGNYLTSYVKHLKIMSKKKPKRKLNKINVKELVTPCVTKFY